MKKKITDFGLKLENEIQKFADTSRLIILPKEAVIAGTPDYTAYIEAKLRNERYA